MKLENQFCTKAQGKRLRELGVTGISAHIFYGKDDDIVLTDMKMAADDPAYSVGELGIMLPVNIVSAKQKVTNKYGVIALKDGTNEIDYSIGLTSKNTEAAARADMLIHMIENGHVNVEEVNQRLLNS